MNPQEAVTPLRAPVVLVVGLEPVAVEGCTVCTAQVEAREAARRVANTTKVKTCNEELVNHPHSETKGAA